MGSGAAVLSGSFWLEVRVLVRVAVVLEAAAWIRLLLLLLLLLLDWACKWGGDMGH